MAFRPIELCFQWMQRKEKFRKTRFRVIMRLLAAVGTQFGKAGGCLRKKLDLGAGSGLG